MPLMRVRLFLAQTPGVGLNIYDEVDPYFARMEHRVQRAGWVVIAILVGLAVAGLFGGGFFSNATARHTTEGGSIELTYPRFGRQQSDLRMVLEVAAPGGGTQALSVTLSGNVNDKVGISSISPEPDTTSVQGDSLVYTWNVEAWTGAQVISFDYEAHEWREVSGRMEVTAGEQALGGLSFSQFLFP